ncbi:HalOD1 output domain-containing protein [Natrinema halophilum]|uniref:Halobacterial output domain-containing protein n=1 Tax=Natrinema halophilum TaxID=1699371 RepID=A0A7D5KQU8_9EURY|nr:HalOD1 output domain-containing protein [Natrinema halophilum]QLG48717.1 hypothetical protein HYG82_07585 [Natrinema halophilum]
MSKTMPTSMRVVQAVAAQEDVDPAELRPPLHAVVDADALDELFPSGGATGDLVRSVEFTYRGNQVSIDSRGNVDVLAASTESEASTAPDR